MKKVVLFNFFILGTLFIGLVLISLILQMFKINAKYFNPVAVEVLSNSKNYSQFSNPVESDNPETDIQWQLKTISYKHDGGFTEH